MNEQIIAQICVKKIGEMPRTIERCAVGQGNYVYIVECEENKYIIRCSLETDAYKDTIYWLEKLTTIEIPVPKVVGKGKYEKYEYLILTYLEGKDIGLVYSGLTEDEKKVIAREIVHIQNKVATLELDNVEPDWSWHAFINYILERAKERIEQNGYFDVEKVERLCGQMGQLEEYFANVEPVAYLDDISSKNLLIHNERLSGIIDIDWIGIGDRLTFVALTYIALLNMECDTYYAKYILEEMQPEFIEKKAFLFYILMYCVDFMGERGMQFMDKRVEVNDQIINRLNNIYDLLWNEWSELCHV